MLTELKKIAGDFLTQPITRGREMRDLLEQSPSEFCSASVELLGAEDGSERVQRYLIALLGTSNLLIPCMADAATPHDKAETIAALARRVDPQLPAKLVNFVLERTEMEPPECLERILGLLRSMPDTANFRPLLTPLLRHPDARIRSKAALLAGEGNRNRTWFERRMQEEDPRVRANAIESAGAAVAEDLKPLFQTAASDTNNRVAGNALVALYRLGDTAAVAGLHELATRPDPGFRATAMWAMSETGDTRFLPLLGKYLTDPNEATKTAAFRAIQKLRGHDSQSQSLEVRILGKPYVDGSLLKVAFGVSSGCKPIQGIAATRVRILINGEHVYRYSISEQECRRGIFAGFLFPRIADQTGDRNTAYRNALDKCFEQRRLVDHWLMSQFSSAAARLRTETLFGVALDSTDVSQSSIRGIGTLSELRNAIENTRCIQLTAAFLGLCERLRPSRGSAHLFVIAPESALPLDVDRLISAAREAHVAVHAICNESDDAIREICQTTGGFYSLSANIAKTLPAFYRGVSHRYLASVTPDSAVRQVQVAVRTDEFAGESVVCEMN